MDLEVSHSNLTSYTLYADKIKVYEGRCKGIIQLKLPYSNIEFWLNPIEQNWGIVPYIRINGFLINHYLAGITIYDHMIQFNFDQHFFENYSKKNFKSILDNVPKDKINDKLYLDTHFSILNENVELVNEIKQILNEKVSTNNNP
jgi:hypothetical protein